MTTTRSGEGPATTTKTSATRTDITIILDRSGSMVPRHAEVIRSFNDLLAEQRAVPGKAKISLVQFDNEYESVYRGVKLADAPNLTPDTYVPRGTTALLDAVGRTIKDTEARLRRRARKRREKGREIDDPRVLVVVVTDGLENASTDHTLEQVRAEITRQETDWNWSFVFLGAGLDAFAQSHGMGMASGRAMRMGASGKAWNRSMGVVSAKMRLMRSLDREASMGQVRSALEFTDEERQEAKDRAGE